MGKSIRSKSKKRARTAQRSTVGVAQDAKHTRKALRRLAAAVSVQGVDGAAGASALAGALAGAGSAPAAAAIRVLAGPSRSRPLRHSFNAGLRAARLAADLEDCTDDEADVRLGRLDAIAAATRAASGVMDGASSGSDGGGSDGDGGPEAAGAKFRAGRTQGKRGNYVAEAVPEFVGFYDSAPELRNPKRSKSHRRGKTRKT
jgi:hypothetical protein